MEGVFLKIIDMSFAASIVIAVISLARLILKKAPKKWSYSLWIAAAFRLCCPVSIGAAFSIFRIVPKSGISLVGGGLSDEAFRIGAAAEARTAVENIASQAVSGITSNAPAVTASPVTGFASGAAEAVGGIAQAPSAPAAVSAFGTERLISIAAMVWIAGVAALAIYALVNYVLLRRRLIGAMKCGDKDVFCTDAIESPFILGMFKPRIYIPFGLSDEERSYVIAHERCHLKRGDHMVKVFSFILLAVHWFNPFCWFAFFLMSRDLEMSCDEKVLSDSMDIKKAYSRTLLSFAIEQGAFPKPSPIAFAESGVKGRVKNAMRYKKPRLAVSLTATVLCILVGAICVLDPAASAKAESEAMSAEVDMTEVPALQAAATEAANGDVPDGTEETTEQPSAVTGIADYCVSLKPNEPVMVDIDFDGVEDRVLFKQEPASEWGDYYYYTIIVNLGGDEANEIKYGDECVRIEGCAWIVDCDTTDSRLDILISSADPGGDWSSAACKLNDERTGFNTVTDWVCIYISDDQPFSTENGFCATRQSNVLGTRELRANMTVTKDGFAALTPYYYENPNDAYSPYTLLRDMKVFIVGNNGVTDEEFIIKAGETIAPFCTDLNSYVDVSFADGRTGRVALECHNYDDDYGIYLNGVNQDEYAEIFYAD